MKSSSPAVPAVPRACRQAGVVLSLGAHRDLPAGPVSLQLGSRGPIVIGRVARRGSRLQLEADALPAWLKTRPQPTVPLALRWVGSDHVVLTPA